MKKNQIQKRDFIKKNVMPGDVFRTQCCELTVFRVADSFVEFDLKHSRTGSRSVYFEKSEALFDAIRAREVVPYKASVFFCGLEGGENDGN